MDAQAFTLQQAFDIAFDNIDALKECVSILSSKGEIDRAATAAVLGSHGDTRLAREKWQHMSSALLTNIYLRESNISAPEKIKSALSHHVGFWNDCFNAAVGDGGGG